MKHNKNNFVIILTITALFAGSLMFAQRGGRGGGGGMSRGDGASRGGGTMVGAGGGFRGTGTGMGGTRTGAMRTDGFSGSRGMEATRTARAPGFSRTTTTRVSRPVTTATTTGPATRPMTRPSTIDRTTAAITPAGRGRAAGATTTARTGARTPTGRATRTPQQIAAARAGARTSQALTRTQLASARALTPRQRIGAARALRRGNIVGNSAWRGTSWNRWRGNWWRYSYDPFFRSGFYFTLGLPWVWAWWWDPFTYWPPYYYRTVVIRDYSDEGAVQRALVECRDLTSQFRKDLKQMILENQKLRAALTQHSGQLPAESAVEQTREDINESQEISDAKECSNIIADLKADMKALRTENQQLRTELEKYIPEQAETDEDVTEEEESEY